MCLTSVLWFTGVVQELICVGQVPWYAAVVEGSVVAVQRNTCELSTTSSFVTRNVFVVKSEFNWTYLT